MLLVTTFFLFFVSAGFIYLACEYFVNGIEWFGRCLNLGATAVGSVLAAFGTALPESAVTFMAVVGHSPAQKDLGVGAAMGGPLVLATLSYAVVGVALLFNKKRLQRASTEVRADYTRMSSDQLAFLVVFVVKVGLGLVVFSIKPWLGILFLLLYAAYVWREIRHSDTAPEEEELEPLKLKPGAKTPHLALASLQVLLALIVIGLASHTFVVQLDVISNYFKWPPHLIAILLGPVATELPEIMNALIWVRQGKERLALANISGAMMIQATIPSAFGIFFTPWYFDGVLLTSGILTAFAIIYLWNMFRRRAADARELTWTSALYAVFIGLVIFYF